MEKIRVGKHVDTTVWRVADSFCLDCSTCVAVVFLDVALTSLFPSSHARILLHVQPGP